MLRKNIFCLTIILTDKGGISILSYDIFDAETGSKFHLLYLLCKKGEWYSLEDLVSDSQMDRKTVLKYIKKLAHDLEEIFTSKPAIKIEFLRGRGYRFTGGKVEYLEAVPVLLDQSISLSLMKELFFHQSLSLDYFLQTHFVSESTVRRRVTQFNRKIKKYGLKIKSANRELSIEGDELQFRYLSYILFWSVYRGTTWPFPTIDEHKIAAFIEKEMKTYSPLRNISTSFWCYIIAINIYRYNQKKQLTEENLPDYTNEINRYVLTKSGVNDTIIDSIKQTFHLSDPEANFIGLLFQIGVRFFLIPTVFDRTLKMHQKLNTPVFQMYQLYFEVFKPNLNRVDTQTQLIFTSLLIVTFLTDSLFPNFRTTMSGYNYSEYLEQNYPFLKEAMLEKLQKMRQLTTLPILKNEEMLVARFCEAHALLESPTSFSPPIYILLETDLPIVMENIIANQLRSILQPFYNIKFVSTIMPPENVEIDLFIATTSSPTLIKKARSTPIVYINASLRPLDIFNIINMIDSTAALNSFT